jgi:membrane fusion protein, macrolide-specific efflux system
MKNKVFLSGKPHLLIRKISAVGLTGAMILSLSGCYLFPKEEKVLAPPPIKSTKVTYDVIEGKIGDIEKAIRGVGYFVSISQFDLAFKYRGGHVSAVHIKPGDKVKQGDVLIELDTDNLETQIKQQELQLRKAQNNYNSIKTEMEINGGGNKSQLENAKIDLDMAQLQLDDLRQQRMKSKLISPVSGVVDYVDPVNVGQYVDAYKAMVRIGDPTKMQLEYKDDKISFFELGMMVDVDINGKKFQGKVVMNPSNVPESADRSRSMLVRIEVVNLPAEVAIGDSANIRLTLQKKQNVLVLPKNAIRTFNGRKYVPILEDGLKKERDVELGIENETQVEIIKGLKEGEKVIVR